MKNVLLNVKRKTLEYIGGVRMKRKGTNVRMTEEMRSKIFDIAHKSGRTLSEIVREAIEEWLKTRERSKACQNSK